MIQPIVGCSALTGVGTVVLTLSATLVSAQPATPTAAPASRYVDAGGTSLDALIQMTLERAPSIHASRARVDAARGQLVQAGLRPSPTVSTERREEVGGTDNQSSVMLQWPLDLFGRTGRVQEAERAFDVSTREADDAARLLAAAVRAQAGRLLAAARQMDVATQLASAMRRAHELLEARVAEGSAPPLERDLAFVEWQRGEATVHRQRADAEAALAQLKALVGLDPTAPLVLREALEPVVIREGQDPRLIQVGLAAETRAAAEQRADVQTAQALVAHAASQVDRARREGRPDVSLFGGYMRMDAGFRQLGFSPSGELTRVRGLFHNASIGAMVTVPWRNRNQGAVAAAEARRRAAEHEHAGRLLAARADIAAAQARSSEARSALAIYTSGLREVAHRNLEVVRESYQLGRVSLFDVVAEQRRYLETEMAYTEALTSAFEARTELTRALGVMP